MQNEAGPIEGEIGGARIDGVALQVDFDKRGGRYLRILQTERIDEKVLVCLVYSNGDVIVDDLRPAVQIDQTIDGGWRENTARLECCSGEDKKVHLGKFPMLT